MMVLYNLADAGRRVRPAPFAVKDGPTIDSGFLADIRAFILGRIERIDPAEVLPEYARLRERETTLYNSLRDLSPGDDYRAMLMEYSDLRSMMQYQEMLILCERAFHEGMRMALWAGREAGQAVGD